MTGFGASAKAGDLYKHFGITARGDRRSGAPADAVTEENMAVRVAINGFGRIGRNVLRAIMESGRKDIEVVAINDLGPVETNAHLFRFDSVHGRFNGEVKVDGDTIDVGRGPIKVTAERDPAKLPHKALGVDIALECTGFFTSKKAASAHLDAGAKRVLVSPRPTTPTSRWSTASTTTSSPRSTWSSRTPRARPTAWRPVAKVLNDAVGIEHGFMTTIHAYTGDQPTLDTMHKDLYRGRAAALSMIPTSTGAAKAVGLVLPELNGKLDGVAIRVPTPNVSVIDFKFVAKRKTDKDEINKAVKLAAANQLKGILGWTDAPNVSIDFNHDSHSSTFHMDQTKVHGRHAGAGHELVRQRMGLLQPHGRHRRGDGQAGLTPRRTESIRRTAPSGAGQPTKGPSGPFLIRRRSIGFVLTAKEPIKATAFPDGKVRPPARRSHSVATPRARKVLTGHA
jgi:glyceraldehyde 3-phosphate dehydrogenase